MGRFLTTIISFLSPILMAGLLRGEEEPLLFYLRNRAETESGSGTYRVVFEKEAWSPKRTAIIICDMWDRHWCRGATRRVTQLAPRVNEVVARARAKGALIVHAPSGTMSAYEKHPARLRARRAPKAPDLPDGIGGWCKRIPAESGGRYPIDQSDGGCDCQPRCPNGSPWRGQIGTIEIHDEDAVSDSGVEIWNLLADRGIQNVVIMGVHTNMCVLGRPFGLRNLARFGKNVVLMRDLTDTMYNSRMWPHVNHFTGTELIVEHIEKFVCPTVLSTALTGTGPFRFPGDVRPRVVILSAESEYGAAVTMPALAGFLRTKCGLAAEVLQGSTEKRGEERNFIPGMEALEDADLAILFARRRALPRRDMKRLRDYLARGKPLLAFRTSSHAFAVRGAVPAGCEEWKTFDRDVLGCHYNGYPHGETEVRVAPEGSSHPVVKGLEGPYRVRETLYRHLPLAETCRVLLWGRCAAGQGDDPRYLREPGAEEPDQPVAWVNTYQNAKVFYTSLGSGRASFREAWFRKMVVNAVFWALGRQRPDAEPAW
jgi:nicotinamidase-related amidase/type 1 glutamine amidotransferase